jgi:hypothetical protein
MLGVGYAEQARKVASDRLAGSSLVVLGQQTEGRVRSVDTHPA